MNKEIWNICPDLQNEIENELEVENFCDDISA